MKSRAKIRGGSEVDMKPLAEILEEIESKIAGACAVSGRPREAVSIVAVTKTHGPDAVCEALGCGLRLIGENKVQEAAWKKPLCPGGAEWHLIGRLQRNKTRAALALFSRFHAIDSLPVLEKLAAVAEETGAAPSIMLEVNVSGERSKGGFSPAEVPAAVEKALSLPRISLDGFMTMAPFEPEPEKTRPVFAGLRELRDAMEVEFGASFPELSMGMTNDYEIAVQEGATLVRLGTVLFGERPKARPQRAVDAGDAGESGEGGGIYDRVLD